MTKRNEEQSLFTQEQLDAFAPPEPPDDFADRVLASLSPREEPVSKSAAAPAARSAWFGWTAAFSLGAASAWILSVGLYAEPTPVAPLRAVSVPVDAQVTQPTTPGANMSQWTGIISGALGSAFAVTAALDPFVLGEPKPSDTASCEPPAVVAPAGAPAADGTCLETSCEGDDCESYSVDCEELVVEMDDCEDCEDDADAYGFSVIRRSLERDISRAEIDLEETQDALVDAQQHLRDLSGSLLECETGEECSARKVRTLKQNIAATKAEIDAQAEGVRAAAKALKDAHRALRDISRAEADQARSMAVPLPPLPPMPSLPPSAPKPPKPPKAAVAPEPALPPEPDFERFEPKYGIDQVDIPDVWSGPSTGETDEQESYDEEMQAMHDKAVAEAMKVYEARMAELLEKKVLKGSKGNKGSKGEKGEKREKKIIIVRPAPPAPPELPDEE